MSEFRWRFARSVHSCGAAARSSLNGFLPPLPTQHKCPATPRPLPFGDTRWVSALVSWRPSKLRFRSAHARRA